MDFSILAPVNYTLLAPTNSLRMQKKMGNC